MLFIACCVALLCSCSNTRRIKSSSSKIETDHHTAMVDSSGAKITLQKDDSKSVSGKTNQTLSTNESDVIIEFESDSAASVTKTTIEEKDGTTIITTIGSKPTGIRKRNTSKKQTNDSAYADSTKSAYAVFGEEATLKKENIDDHLEIAEETSLQVEKRRIWIGVFILVFLTAGAVYLMYRLDKKFKQENDEINATAHKNEV